MITNENFDMENEIIVESAETDNGIVIVIKDSTMLVPYDYIPTLISVLQEVELDNFLKNKEN